MQKSKPTVVACVPAFNEEKTIAKVVLLARRHVDRVVICDDGSSDLTGEIAEGLGADVVRHRRNMGKGAALKTLFKKAREMNPDVVVTLDSDGQHDPDEIPKLIQPIVNNEADIVNGSRFLERRDMPKHRMIGNRMLNLLANMKMDQKLTDTQSGFRAYSRKALEVIDVAEKGIGVDSQILMDASEKRLRIVEVPIGVSYKEARSKHNPVVQLGTVVDSIIGKIVEENPMLYLGVPGLMSAIAGLLAGLRVIEIFLAKRAIATGTAMISVALIMVGFLLIIAAIMVKAMNSVAEKVKREFEA